MDKYYVFMVFYKKGKYKVKEFDNDDEMRDFLINYLNKYKKYCIIKNLNICSLYDLIHESIKVGLIVKDQRAGYSVVKAIGGEEIEDSSSEDSEDEYDESYSSQSLEDENVVEL